MLKKEARKLYRKRREALSEQEKMKADDLILIHFQQLSLPFVTNVLSYFPIEDKDEIDPFLITRFLSFANPGLQVAYPKTNFSDYSMTAILPDNDAFTPNEYNIMEPASGAVLEPSSLDLVLVPLLICDVYGNRVGYGKGFYDRFLKQCRSDCLKIGFSYFEPIDSIEDADEFDVPLNICITPQKAYVF